jgi:hypothetical protein
VKSPAWRRSSRTFTEDTPLERAKNVKNVGDLSDDTVRRIPAAVQRSASTGWLASSHIAAFVNEEFEWHDTASVEGYCCCCCGAAFAGADY